MSKTFIPGKRLVRNWFCGALQTKPVYKPVFSEIGITRAGAYARTHARTNRLRNNNNRTTPQYRNVSPWSQVRTLIIKKRNSSAGNHKVTNWSMLRRTLKNIYWNFQPITISCKQWKNPLCSVEIVQMENVLVTHGGVASGETGWGGEKMSLISPPSPPLWFSVG